LENLKSGTVRLPGGNELPVVIESTWRHNEVWVLKFQGIDSISAAESFKGSELCIPLEQRGELGAGEYFQSDLIGCLVVEKSDDRVLGRVQGLQQYGGAPMLDVRVGERDVLIPFVPAICQEVDLSARKLKVELPDGLLEL
jgi:16S rRNA processing protein RimM